MDTSTIASIEVLFARGRDQCTRLSIVRQPELTYAVKAIGSRSYFDCYTIQELTERHGIAQAGDLRDLFGAIELTRFDRWYHHYGNFEHKYINGILHSDNLRWSVRLTDTDERSLRWEGANDTPAELGVIYEACASVGMPGLQLGYYGSFANFASRCRTGGDAYDLALTRIERYEDLLTEALQRRTLLVSEATEDEYEVLAQEFREDLSLFLTTYQAKPLAVCPPGEGMVPLDMRELCARETQGASKEQVYQVLATLLAQEDPQEAVRIAIRSKAYQRWMKRLREIPQEEARERARLEEVRREEKRQKLDAQIEERIRKGDTFTAADVARDVDTTCSMANGRIRRFVLRGLLATVGDESPRIYCAA